MARRCHCSVRPWRWCPSQWRGQRSRWPQTSPRWLSRSRQPCGRSLTPPTDAEKVESHVKRSTLCSNIPQPSIHPPSKNVLRGWQVKRERTLRGKSVTKCQPFSVGNVLFAVEINTFNKQIELRQLRIDFSPNIDIIAINSMILSPNVGGITLQKIWGWSISLSMLLLFHKMNERVIATERLKINAFSNLIDQEYMLGFSVGPRKLRA